MDELVVQPAQALPLFIFKMRPLPQDARPREIPVEFDYTNTLLEVESELVASVEYLVAALQHHFKTADHLKVEYLDEVGQVYLPLTDVGVLNQGDLSKHKLRVTKVPDPFSFQC